MSKKKKLNLKRFIPFCIVCVLLLTALVILLTKIFDRRPGNNRNCSHVYENGYCVKCGKGDPNYVPPEPEDERLSWPDTSTAESEYPLAASSDDMLVLVNKTHTLSKDYIPDDLVDVKYYDPEVGNAKLGTRSVRRVVAEAFNTLCEDAKAAGKNIVLRNGYRSYDYQTSLYNSYASKYGKSEADKFSARPGTSEHQSGWCLDAGKPGVYLDDFTGTPEAEWLADNCCKYGFILRYTDGTATEVGPKTGYIAESWHIRYVGKEAAKIIYENDWTLEEYLEQIAEAKKEQ